MMFKTSLKSAAVILPMLAALQAVAQQDNVPRQAAEQFQTDDAIPDDTLTEAEFVAEVSALTPGMDEIVKDPDWKVFLRSDLLGKTREQWLRDAHDRRDLVAVRAVFSEFEQMKIASGQAGVPLSRLLRRFDEAGPAPQNTHPEDALTPGEAAIVGTQAAPAPAPNRSVDPSSVQDDNVVRSGSALSTWHWLEVVICAAWIMASVYHWRRITRKAGFGTRAQWIWAIFGSVIPPAAFALLAHARWPAGNSRDTETWQRFDSTTN